MPYNANEEEKKILNYWKEYRCFEKSVEQRPEGKPYVFYDGPPFATGLPHYGHIVASLMKDIVPRYWTMKGRRVERQWGWDCHGLPIENIIEEKLHLKTKKDIESYGIDKFNDACYATVLTYTDEWKKTIERMGRWVDMDNAYQTMHPSFMESVWWVFKQLWDKGLIYEGRKAMHICPRCATALSNFEVTQGYKDVKDIAVTVKFRVKNAKERLGEAGEVYALAWTTTPWTLPGNALLAVNPQMRYALASFDDGNGEKYLVAADRLSTLEKGGAHGGNADVEIRYGEDLVGLEYEPLFPYYADTPRAFRIVAADFVTADEGTGIVHIAPAFGEDDYAVGQAEQVPLIQHVSMDGTFTKEVADFAGMDVKPKDDRTATDVLIIKYLAAHGALFAKQTIAHSYPHCWRCDTPLLNYATASWFVRVTELKDDLLRNNAKTSWVPDHMKDGRFGKWLEGAHDWAISRSRYWGSVLPVWKSEDGDTICVGSIRELEELSGQTVRDLHKHSVDKIIIRKDGKTYHRVPEVLDCWFESGSMPYGQMHYPFENKRRFERGFPAEFIAEGQDQTRGWFYTLHVLATALTRGEHPSIPVAEPTPAFRTVVVNGIVLAEDGRKMSKRLKNYPDPMDMLEKYGADAMRYYLAASPVMHGESLNFSEAGVREMYNKVVNTAWNVFEFYRMFAADAAATHGASSHHPLDIWIRAKLKRMIAEVTEHMDSYHLAEAARPIEAFITELSQWYVRRSRARFKASASADKAAAAATLRDILLSLSKVMAPFTPFIAEMLYQGAGGEKESVHLEDWIETDAWTAEDEAALRDMDTVRGAVELGLALRAEAGIKVRQTLGACAVSGAVLSEDLCSIIADELNVKAVISGIAAGNGWPAKEYNGITVVLDIEITDALKKEGLVREIVRTVNQMRKDEGLTVQDAIVLSYATEDAALRDIFASYADEIRTGVLASEIREAAGGIRLPQGAPGEKTVDIGGSQVALLITRSA
jgi:isoleucyl-tRNA synthetase